MSDWQRMSDIELVVRRSNTLAHRLVVDLRAPDGRDVTFQQRVTQVQRRLPQDVIRALRRVGAIRNDLVHRVDLHSLTNRDDFIQTCDYIEDAIATAAGKRRHPGPTGMRGRLIEYVRSVLERLLRR